ncbi:MAG: hypothetical protein ACE5HE_04705 [Phycisphaerae bacterium]
MSTMKSFGLLVFLAVVSVVSGARGQAPVGTAFSYQGQLKRTGRPVSAVCDFEFSLWDDPLAPESSHLLNTQLTQGVALTDGLFAIELDFGGDPFDGSARWLGIAVCCPGAGDPPDYCAGPPVNFVALSPRQKLTPVPYALRTVTASTGNVHSLDAADGDPVDAVFVDNYGRVGVGTLTPVQRMSVFGGMNIDQGNANDGVLDIDAPALRFGSGVSGEAIASKRTQGGRRLGLDFYTDSINRMSILRSGEVKYYNHPTDAQRRATITLDPHFGESGESAILMRNPSGTETFHVSSSTVTTGASELMMFNGTGMRTVRLRAAEGGNQGADIELSNSAGEVTIQLDADIPGTGEGRVVTQVLQITGGGDLSEQFDVNAGNNKPEPGMVVCIDQSSPGKLAVCNRPYDRTVAGIISGAAGIKPGMLMGQKASIADGQHAIALTGRVYVLADAANGAIEPGDLLTTGNTPGRAMKVTDQVRAQGAVLGKAMTALPDGKGLVLALVSLQ